MSGIYIKGMEMPRKCIHCELQTYGLCSVQGDKDISKAVADSVRNADCPLIPVPDHGRLIDADALGEFPYNMDFCDGGEADEWVRNAPTIIPVDKEGEA